MKFGEKTFVTNKDDMGDIPKGTKWRLTYNGFVEVLGVYWIACKVTLKDERQYGFLVEEKTQDLALKEFSSKFESEIKGEQCQTSN